MKRADIINREIQNNNYKTYLEIGVCSGTNIKAVRCDYKVGVDPDPMSKNTTHNLTSDDFFIQNKEKFDIVFIDGLHEYGQVLRDIDNSLNVLNHGGTIVLHDMNPPSEKVQAVPRVSNEWTGDCWKAMVDYRLRYKSISFTINTDYGVGIIKPHIECVDKDIKVDEYTYSNLVKYKKQWLGLIDISEYLNNY